VLLLVPLLAMAVWLELLVGVDVRQGDDQDADVVCIELVDLRSRGPRVRAPAGSAVALLEEGRAEPEPEPAQQYVSMRLRDMRGQ
jgi:hypothetical protein